MNKERNDIFQKLKPPCVNLSQIALTWGRNSATSKDIVASLDALLKVLQQVAQPLGPFDKNLADYVFFPLSHVFRPNTGIPERALELALECLDLLLSCGWRNGVPSQLDGQILILLTLLLGQKSAKNGASQRSEELQRAAFNCLSRLFRSYDASKQSEKLTEDPLIPHLLEVATLMLRGMTDGQSSEVRLSAISALQSFQSCIKDKEVLASFFPGTVSSLTKVLNPNDHRKPPWRITRDCLKLLSEVLGDLLADIHTKQLIHSDEPSESSKEGRVIMTASWLKATASQVKLALATVVKLRHDVNHEVRKALCDLCLLVLERCRGALSDAVSMVVETLIILSETLSESGSKEIAASVKHLAMTDLSVLDSIKSSLHTWVVSLPRHMQSNDDRVKRRLISQISASFLLLSEVGASSDIVDDILAANLRDSVVASIKFSSKRPQMLESTESSNVPSSSLELSNSRPILSTHFQPVLVGYKEQEDTLKELGLLLRRLGASDSAMVIAQDLLGYLYGASGDTLLSVFWLSLTTVRDGLNTEDSIDELINYDSSASDLQRQLLEELYSYSLNVLSQPWSEDQPDWRLQALALETIALLSGYLREGFRPELVDALFPVVHLIGSPLPQLREHAITCLNVLAQACGYATTSELVLSNVDYLVNAVALKLNTFDISPQAPQVLLMMIKLTGPSLIPYLDDLVGSIFTALDSYHGYPRLVELLFAVLNGIVEEGSKGDAFLAITSGNETIDHRKKATTLRSVDDVVVMLEKRKTKKEAQKTDQSLRDRSPTPETEPGSYPHRPWKEDRATHTTVPLAPSPSNEEEHAADAADNDENDESSTTVTKHTKTYSTLHSISHLTQHYLSHASPTLRLSLLQLLHTSLPPLATDEDTFLPLVNDIWPPLALRLHDSEAFVVAVAADTVALMCRLAGDFMAGRVEAEWDRWKTAFSKWETEAGVGQIAAQTRQTKRPRPGNSDVTPRRRESGSKQHTGSLVIGPAANLTAGGTRAKKGGPWSQGWRTWTSWIRLWASVIGHVRIGDDVREDVLARLGPYLHLDLAEIKEVRGLLDEWNSDAVWWEVAVMQGGDGDGNVNCVRDTPKLDGVRFADFTT